MHRDSWYEVSPQLVRYKLAGEGVGARGTLHRLRRQLSELLRDEVMILSELLQQMMVRLLQECRINLLWVELLLPPCTRLRSPI